MHKYVRTYIHTFVHSDLKINIFEFATTNKESIGPALLPSAASAVASQERQSASGYRSAGQAEDLEWRVGLRLCILHGVGPGQKELLI